MISLTRRRLLAAAAAFPVVPAFAQTRPLTCGELTARSQRKGAASGKPRAHRAALLRERAGEPPRRPLPPRLGDAHGQQRRRRRNIRLRRRDLKWGAGLFSRDQRAMTLRMILRFR